jgi:L-aspartate oxidase
MELGARFDRDAAGDLALGREGGHSASRIVHAKDQTGREIQRALRARVDEHPEVQLLEQRFALDLWVGSGNDGRSRCYGASFFDPESGEVGVIRSRQTMLATGGAGKVYLYTSNPDVATGDGLAMAARAGCALVNLEMVQFHPTCLYHPDAKSFLISEAVRGEGAVIRNLDGEEFLLGRHEMGSLAPRDVVAREIDRELKSRGDKHVFLDVSAIEPHRFRERFPHISARLERFGLVPGEDAIPVVPAAHYMCGGVAVDMDARTSVEGLFASGEVAGSGIHGANRLASNSLLEAAVLADRAARLAPPQDGPEPPPPPIPPGAAAGRPDLGVILDHEWDNVRRLMWDYVGLARSQVRLERAMGRLRRMREWVEDLYLRTPPSRDLAELRNIALVGSVVATAAHRRHESRGLHSLMEYPETDAVPRESWATLAGAKIQVEMREIDGREVAPG